MEATHTLKSIADSVGVAKRTAEGWLQAHKEETGEELGQLIDGARRFTDAERDLLVARCKKRPEVAKQSEFIRSTSIEETGLIVRAEVQLPDTFDASVGMQHFDGAQIEVTDPHAIVHLAKQMFGALSQKLDQKIQVQREELAQHEEALEELQELKTAALTDLKIKASVSELLADRQSKATRKLHRELGDISGLGKPSEDS